MKLQLESSSFAELFTNLTRLIDVSPNTDIRQCRMLNFDLNHSIEERLPCGIRGRSVEASLTFKFDLSFSP
jgi:hypothetical protein